MASPSVPDVSIDISGPFNGIYSSSYICAALLGISIAQTYMYFRNYPKDRIILKLFVLWLLGLNTASQILVVKGLSRPLLKNWANVVALQSAVPEFVWQILTTGLLSSSAQIFFTYRLWFYSSKNILYPLVLVPAALSQLVADIIYIVGALGSDTTNTSLHDIDFERAATAANSIAVGVDILIAALMGYRLLTSRSGFARTDRMVNTLFVITVNSGLWTAIVAIIALAASLKFSNILNYAAIYITLAPLYCNTVLANLNVRDYVRSKGENENTMSVLSGIKFKTTRRGAHGAYSGTGSMPQFAVTDTAPSSNMDASTVVPYDSYNEHSKENLRELKPEAI
ncbi:hypothetical protein CPB84DRAFT_1788493 [Gymnopilus junonius]|uniref:DUF6534 domain-containing protein n=1 Tax=Gymnopilus junonius TaxID=109634 RepID=A0A9P5TIL1_GYMJU|nr:hypothetical protein CPB84DRAFT_1788493 [Gymnopilus junonius]